MNNKNENLEIKPIIFNKKKNTKSKVIPLKIINNDFGQARHFPSTNMEWFNSVYAYNNNYIKSLPVADKNLMDLVKSYFNFYFSRMILKSKRIRIRFKRLSVKKIFVGKAELKHTSSKITITLYVYNEEKRLLTRKIKKLTRPLLFPTLPLSFKLNSDESLTANRSLSLKEKLSLVKAEHSHLVKLVENENLLVFNKNSGSFDRFNTSLYNDLRIKVLEKELIDLTSYKLLLNLNKAKFEESFLLKLSHLVSKLYNKEVEFNIVNLKNFYLNSDIFTQAISLKLKNRDNKLLRVLRRSLYTVKLPNVNKVREKYGKGKKEQLFIDNCKNTRINSILSKDISNNDALNQLLLDIFPQAEGLSKQEINKSIVNRSSSIDNLILNSLNYKTIAGVRLEAKGRLTRRFTAEKSVFKVKWKGGLRNIDSSYKGLSTVMLRGHAKSNVQYSMVNTKNRNGAFGVKGWISSK